MDSGLAKSETWERIVGYDNYEVSTLGRVRTIPYVNSYKRRVRGRILSLSLNSDGHYKVELRQNGVRKTEKVHQLVLITFVGPCPPGQECRHKNGIHTDNRPENLEWNTRSVNMLDRAIHKKAS